MEEFQDPGSGHMILFWCAWNKGFRDILARLAEQDNDERRMIDDWLRPREEA